jgi:hypothetical protein
MQGEAGEWSREEPPKDEAGMPAEWRRLLWRGCNTWGRSIMEAKILHRYVVYSDLPVKEKR